MVLPPVLVLAGLLRTVLLLVVELLLLFWVGLGLGLRLEVEEDLVLEMWGDRSRAGGILSLLRGGSDG